MSKSKGSQNKRLQQQLHIAWTKFTKGAPFDSSVVAPHVLHSWQISKEQNINAETTPIVNVLTKHELARLLQEHDQLLEAAEPVMDMVEISIRETGFIATLACTPGLLLKVVGDPSVLSHAERRDNVPGAIRTTEALGGSALSMSMIENMPLQISGCEHYNRYLHGWTCSSAPIHDEHENVVGSLTISGHMPNKNKHTLAMVTAAASTISTRFREKRLIYSEQRLSSMLTSVYNSLSEGVLAIDTDLNITHANKNAVEMLGLRHANLLGKHVETILHHDEKHKVLLAIKGGLTTSLEIPFSGSHDTKLMMCRLIPTRLTNGETVGTTITITPRSQLIQIARQVGGNYAKYSFSDIKGDSSQFVQQVELARRAATTGSRILLTGESGTGKELFAQAIHNGSLLRTGPFVAISCAAIPRDLIESELFGYVGGAFTGARSKGMVGKFELANHGTLFLDEINSLPLEMQAKLLRALQQREVTRIGDTKPTAVNARIIAATNTDLKHAIEQGSFREDLYYRLNVVEITIPPLRARQDDIPTLARHILERQSKEAMPASPAVTKRAMVALQEYQWPGNIRELDNVCERALLVSPDGVIRVEHLPDHISNRKIPNKTLGVSLEKANHEIIKRALANNHGNISKTAKELGIARTTLYRQIRKFTSSVDEAGLL